MEWVGLRTVSRGGGFAASFALVLAAAACGGSTPSSSPSDQQSTRTYVVRSSAMEPTFHCAHGPGCRARVPDKVLASPITNPRRGEPVVYRLPPLGRSRCGPRWPVIGRVAALPGEAWQDSGGRSKVPDNAVEILGDNRASACDSRIWGPLPLHALLGEITAVVRYGKVRSIARGGL